MVLMTEHCRGGAVPDVHSALARLYPISPALKDRGGEASRLNDCPPPVAPPVCGTPACHGNSPAAVLLLISLLCAMPSAAVGGNQYTFKSDTITSNPYRATTLAALARHETGLRLLSRDLVLANGEKTRFSLLVAQSFASPVHDVPTGSAQADPAGAEQSVSHMQLQGALTSRLSYRTRLGLAGEQYRGSYGGRDSRWVDTQLAWKPSSTLAFSTDFLSRRSELSTSNPLSLDTLRLTAAGKGFASTPVAFGYSAAVSLSRESRPETEPVAKERLQLGFDKRLAEDWPSLRLRLGEARERRNDLVTGRQTERRFGVSQAVSSRLGEASFLFEYGIRSYHLAQPRDEDGPAFTINFERPDDRAGLNLYLAHTAYHDAGAADATRHGASFSYARLTDTGSIGLTLNYDAQRSADGAVTPSYGSELVWTNRF